MQTSGGAGLLTSMHLVSIIFGIRVNNAPLCFHHSWVSAMCFQSKRDILVFMNKIFTKFFYMPGLMGAVLEVNVDHRFAHLTAVKGK